MNWQQKLEEIKKELADAKDNSITKKSSDQNTEKK